MHWGGTGCSLCVNSLLKHIKLRLLPLFWLLRSFYLSFVTVCKVLLSLLSSKVSNVAFCNSLQSLAVILVLCMHLCPCNFLCVCMCVCVYWRPLWPVNLSSSVCLFSLSGMCLISEHSCEKIKSLCVLCVYLCMCVCVLFLCACDLTRERNRS